jgi:hypothetical protein
MEEADVLRSTSCKTPQTFATPVSRPSAITDTEGVEAATRKTLAPNYPQERDHFSTPAASPGFVGQGHGSGEVPLIVQPIDFDIAATGPVSSIPSTPAALPPIDEGDHTSLQDDSAEHRNEIDILRAEVNPRAAEDSIIMTETENDTQMIQSSELVSGVAVDIPPSDPAVDCIVAKDEGRPAATDVGMAEYSPRSDAPPPSIHLNRLSTNASVAERKRKLNDRGSRADATSDQKTMDIHPMTTITAPNSILSCRSPASQPAMGKLEDDGRRVGIPTDPGVFTVRPRNHIFSPSISSTFGKSRTDRPRNNSWEARVKAAMERTLQRKKTTRTLMHGGLGTREDFLHVSHRLVTADGDLEADVDSIPSRKELSDFQVDTKPLPLERPVAEESKGSILDRSPNNLEIMDADTNSTCGQYSGVPSHTNINLKDGFLTGYRQTCMASHSNVNHTPVMKKLASTLRNTLGGLTDALETLEQEDIRVSALLSSQLPLPFSSVSTSHWHVPSDASFVSGLLKEIQTHKERICDDTERILEQDMYIERLQNEINSLRRQVLHLNTQKLEAEPSLSSSSSPQHLWDYLPNTFPHPLSHLLPQTLPILTDSGEPSGSEHRHSPPSRTPSPSAGEMYDGGSPLPIKSKRKHVLRSPTQLKSIPHGFHAFSLLCPMHIHSQHSFGVFPTSFAYDIATFFTTSRLHLE